MTHAPSFLLSLALLSFPSQFFIHAFHFPINWMSSIVRGRPARRAPIPSQLARNYKEEKEFLRTISSMRRTSAAVFPRFLRENFLQRTTCAVSRSVSRSALFMRAMLKTCNCSTEFTAHRFQHETQTHTGTTASYRFTASQRIARSYA